jgi:hypothetical protein
MATILDSFFVSVGLDASQFVQGQREADQSFKKIKDETVATAKNIEESTNKFAGGLGVLAKQAAGFFGVLLSAVAIKKFVADVTAANTQLAVLSANLQMQPQVISEWGMAIERAGGNAASAMSAFQVVAAKVFEMNKQGKGLPTEFWQLSAASHVQIDPSNAEALAESLAKAAAALAKMGERNAAFEYLIHGGINPDMANTMIDHGDNIQKYLAGFHDLAPTDAQLKGSQELTKAWSELQQQAFSLGRNIEADINTPLIKFVDFVKDAIKATDDLFKKWDTGIVPGSPQEKLKQTLDSGKAAPAIENWFESSVEKWLGKHFQVRTNEDWRGELSTGARSIGDWLEKNLGIAKSKADELTPEQLAKGLGGGQPRHPMTPTPGTAYNFGAMPTMSDFQQGKLDVDGRPVSRGNPMPVTIANWAEGMANSFLGGPIGSGKPLDGTPGGVPGGRDGTGPRASRSIRDRGTGGSEAPAPETAGTYRPVYKLTPKDTSDAVVNTIAGEAIGGNPKSIDAVINNMLNRVGTHTYGPSGNLEEVARAKGQYTGYRTPGVAEAELIRSRIRSIASGGVPDSTKGSNEYRADWYHGPWGWNHPEATHVGGNAFAYNPKGGVGPYAAYAQPKHWPAHPHSQTPGLWHAGGSATGPVIPAPGKQSLLWNGTGGGGHQHLANLSSVAANNHVMNNSSSNAFHVGDVHVNAPHAKDSKAIADSIADALQLSLHASLADYGQA